MLTPAVREGLRELVGDGAYTATFQSFNRFRTALQQRTKPTGNADGALQLKPAMETSIMIDQDTQQHVDAQPQAPRFPVKLPCGAIWTGPGTISYPYDHVHSRAQRRVKELEQLLMSRSVVDVRALTRYTVRPLGGMDLDQSFGPWVLLIEVMAGARPAHRDDEALAGFGSAMALALADARGRGRSGWQDPYACSDGHLAASLIRNVEKGHFVDAANYAMMLYHRGAIGSVLAAALTEYVSEHAEPAKSVINTLRAVRDLAALRGDADLLKLVAPALATVGAQ